MTQASQPTIVINDFSPGIWGDHHLGTGSFGRGTTIKNGAATIQNTYRCCVDQTGALMPLPARTAGASLNPPRDTTNAAQWSSARPGMYLLDTIVAGPVGGGTAGNEGAPNVFALYHMRYIPTGAAALVTAVLGKWFRYHTGVGSDQDFYWTTLANSKLVAPGIQPAHIVMARDASAGTPTPLTDIHIVTSVAGGLNAGAYGLGEATDTTADAMAHGAVYPSMATAYPDTANPATNDFTNITNTGNFVYSVGHQGRVVWVDRTPSTFAGVTWNSDQLAYTATPNVLGTTITRGMYGEENVNRIAALVSVTADELLIICDSGGGYLIKGDLNNPTVMRLPFIEPAFGVSMRPAVTPLGVVYATRNGIFLWNGGDTTQKLSTQIDGFFHRINDNWNFYAAMPGRLDYWHPFVAVPNNYLYDTRTNSWWRLEDPTVHGLGVPYSHYNTLPSTGWLYAFPLRVDDVDSTVAWDTFDWNTLASSYSWQSQPLVETRDRIRSFQEVTIVVSPGNDAVADKKVYVNLKGIGQNGVPVTPVEVTFTFTGDPSGNGYPLVLRKDIEANFVAMYVQLEVFSDGISGVAPKIHSISIGTRDRQTTVKGDL